MELGSAIVAYDQFEGGYVAKLVGLVTTVKSDRADKLPDVAFRGDRMATWINSRLKQIRTAVNQLAAQRSQNGK